MKNHFYILALILAISCRNSNEEATGRTDMADSQQTNVGNVSANNTLQSSFDLLSEKIGTLRSGLSMEEVVKQLSDPVKKSGIEMWEADGEFHQAWEYNGVELDMSGVDSAKLGINAILLTAPSALKTSRNIGIGSSLSDVQNAYGKYFNKEESNDTVWVAGSIYGGLIFNIRNDKVNRIFLGAAAE